MNKANIKRFLRKIGVIKISDNLRFHWMKVKQASDNNDFKSEFPNTPIPPDYLLYESFNLSYRNYYNSGINTAKFFKKMFDEHLDFNNCNVLDWGCGPSRIIRHFPELAPNANFFGTDYNKKTITWNQANIKNVEFSLNNLNPPTAYADDFFDAIYGISVFTHLSESLHYKWINELWRISKPNAIIIVTTHGNAFREKLLAMDKNVFDDHKLVVQANTLEGHRTFAAYQPPEFMLNLFIGKFKVLEHLEGKIESWGISQDKWLIKVMK